MADKEGKEEMCCGKKVPSQVVKLAKEIVALGMLYSLIAHTINKTYLLLSGAYKTMTLEQITTDTPIAVPGISITLPDPVVEILFVCIIGGVITSLILQWVCSEEWVQESVKVEKCWEEVKWYNPFSWVVALVCTLVEVLKWVLKQICGWKEVLVTALVIICVAVGIIIIVA